MATKAELAARLGDPNLAKTHKRDELVRMVDEGFVADHDPDDLVSVYNTASGGRFEVPSALASRVAGTQFWSLEPVEPVRKDG